VSVAVTSRTAARGLDHIVHAVHDLDAAAQLYRRLGFTVGARNRHPPEWGTCNHIVQLPGFFVELLAIAEPSGIAPHEPRKFSFGAFNRDFLAHAEGLSMLVLESASAQAAADEFAAAGIGAFDLFTFEREGKRPDGATVKLGFSLAFARDAGAPRAGFFVCQRHHPENFWSPAFQAHPNTACAVAGAVLVAENPTDHHIFFSAFSGERELQATSTGVSVTTPRGAITVMDPDAYRIHYGIAAPDISSGARLAALRLIVRDQAAAAAILAQEQIAASRLMDRLIVGPESAMGATIVLEPA
jgi:Glyoxalase-like domain